MCRNDVGRLLAYCRLIPDDKPGGMNFWPELQLVFCWAVFWRVRNRDPMISILAVFSGRP
jgi:hypothetical protein